MFILLCSPCALTITVTLDALDTYLSCPRCFGTQVNLQTTRTKKVSRNESTNDLSRSRPLLLDLLDGIHSSAGIGEWQMRNILDYSETFRIARWDTGQLNTPQAGAVLVHFFILRATSVSVTGSFKLEVPNTLRHG